MPVKLNSSGGGSVTVDVPSTATDYTQTLVAVTGTLTPLVSATAQNSTSGTSIDFTGIPSWAKRITIMYNGVSTSGSAALIVQIGSGSVVTTGYSGTGTGYSGTSSGASTAFTAGFGTEDLGNAAFLRYGHSVLTNISGNTWIFSSVISTAGSAASRWGAGTLTLSGALDRVRITSTNGTDTFDAGTINIMYEG